MAKKTQEQMLDYLLENGSISRAEASELFGLNKDGYWNAIRGLRKKGFYIVSRRGLGDSMQTRCFLKSEDQRQVDAQKETYTRSKNFRLWLCWSGMRGRCNNPKDTNYPRYGARGIKVCEEWNNAFQPFAEWAMANGYDDCLTLDRINNDGNYEPSNCRWTDAKTQCRNRSNNRLITYHGQTKTLTEWSESLRIPLSTLWRRLKNGMDVEEAFTTPVRKRSDNPQGTWVAG